MNQKRRVWMFMEERLLLRLLLRGRRRKSSGSGAASAASTAASRNCRSVSPLRSRAADTSHPWVSSSATRRPPPLPPRRRHVSSCRQRFSCCWGRGSSWLRGGGRAHRDAHHPSSCRRRLASRGLGATEASSPHATPASCTSPWEPTWCGRDRRSPWSRESSANVWFSFKGWYAVMLLCHR